MITAKPKKEVQANRFIAGAGNGSRPRRNIVRIITNFDQELLERVDLAAAAAELNRSAFIVSVIKRRLQELDNIAARKRKAKK